MPGTAHRQPNPEQTAPEGMDIDHPPGQDGQSQSNASVSQNATEPPDSLMQLFDCWIPKNEPLSDRVAVLDRVTKLLEFSKPQLKLVPK
jgi:hypothetical protein